MMATPIPAQSARSPMSPLHSQENILPLDSNTSPPKKSIQLGIEAFATKRARESLENPRIKKPKPTDPEAADQSIQANVPRVICHQCRQPVHPHLSVRCTVIKKAGGAKNPSTRRCPTTYCQRCVANRYGEKLMDIVVQGETKKEGHDPEAGYCWECPSCRGICNCSVCRKRNGLAPLGPMAKQTSSEGTEKPKEKTKEKVKKKAEKEKSAGQGIQSFFSKVDANDDRQQTPEAAKVYTEETLPPEEPHMRTIQQQAQPTPSRKRKLPKLKVVEPPTFHPVRASIPDASFPQHLKIREFVLRFEKVFTRKLHVPTKHIISLGDPCDMPSTLAIKHLFVALLKIIQVDLTEKDEQQFMKDTLKKIEKSPAGHENVLAATVEWLTAMGDTYIQETEMEIACKLIDWAAGTTVCRDDMESDIEKLRILKSENVTAIKALRTDWEEKKTELYKDRLRIVEKDLVEQWKTQVHELDQQYKHETATLSSNFWIESRSLTPRTTSLGTDVLGNKYWVFSSRKTKTRDFGGWLVIQTEGLTPSQTPLDHTLDEVDSSAQDAQDDERTDSYSPLKSWYYVEKAADIKQLISWTTYLAAKATLAQERQEKKPRGSPNKAGQIFAVEIARQKLKGPGKGRRPVEFNGVVETRNLCEELVHAAEWIEERWPEEEEEVVAENGNQVEIEGEVIVLDD